MYSRVNVSGTVIAADGSLITLSPPEITNINPVGAVFEVTLSTAPTTIAVPSGAVGFSVTPPAGNSTAITFKTSAGDTGTRIHNTVGIPAMGIDPSVTALILVAASGMSSATVVKFF